MNVVAFNGSPNKNGNTYHAIQMVADALAQEGIATEIIHVGNKAIRGCLACGQCFKKRNEQCVQTEDPVNEWIQKMKAADGILLGSPVHFSAIGGTMKSFLDRVFYVTGVNNGMLRHKVGASVVAVRRSGGLPTFNQLNNFICYSEMLMPSANYWNVIHGTRPGEAVKDEEGTQIMRTLGKNMAWLMKLVEHGKATIPPPERENKIYMNFIR
ncbi:NADPH-dependent FMN reductase [Desulfobulbus propionicus DSM 2032]|jgi:multimeric flavodoxin WrbA|uniref:NADPH-dependent FMN reductase n=1 Tax=Desulfobulbus propionicus (strain ATCC 33891 / DSM 2032 / VKM B-1956 / 1pr3) TaxID=577650 RepID=A0A7U4DNR0_DESPD|nr:flavodoxin family protein [Desulfobulbus propionicus]ADW17341.1 NADPH-dependent FMN reductase [Desulfobulbus propionicus DSM 2032]